MIKRVLDFSHQLICDAVSPGDVVIDATAGNGHDTVFLSRITGVNGKVLAFDIQEQAIQAVKEKTNQFHITNVTAIQDGHENIASYLDPSTAVSAAIFNLGYLPGSDKTIMTRPESTIKAVKTILHFLQRKGIIVLVVYYGHQGGKEEKESLLQYVSELNQQKFNVLQYGFINQQNEPPFIIAIEKR